MQTWTATVKKRSIFGWIFTLMNRGMMTTAITTFSFFHRFLFRVYRGGRELVSDGDL